MRKKIIIIGGSTGIGRATVEKFYGQNFDVLFSYNNSVLDADILTKDLLSKFPNNENMLLKMKFDAENIDEIETLFSYAKKSFGTIDNLVCCQGFCKNDMLFDVDYKDVIKTFNINLFSTILACKEYAKIAQNQENGNIVLVSSIYGDIGASCESVYAASKGAINAFAKSIAHELAPKVRVNCVAPGATQTKMLNMYSENELEDFASQCPLKRLATPAEIANCIFFLATEQSSYITSQIISPNGGLY